LKDIHFEPKYGGGGAWVTSCKIQTWLLVLCLDRCTRIGACLYQFYINLSRQALTRAKEVGVRKSVRAGRYQLIVQFLVESCNACIRSSHFIIAVAQACLPPMNSLLDKALYFDLLKSPSLLGALFVNYPVNRLVAGIFIRPLNARFNPAANS